MCEICKKREGVTTTLYKGKFVWACDPCFRKNGCK